MMNLRRRKNLLWGIIALMCLSLFSPSYVKATPLFELAQDTISDSDLGAVATHNFIASTTLAIPAGGTFEIIFASNFSTIASTSMDCPGVSSSTVVAGNTVTCTYGEGLAAGPYTFSITGVTNPATAGSYLINFYTKNGGTAIERSSVVVAIINDVDVSASVDPYLTFSIRGLATSSEVNGVITTGSSTAELMAFGVLSASASSTIGQSINVITNAPNGFSVTVFQDHNLLSGNGADIDSFLNGTPASTTAYAWGQPTVNINDEKTWGHFGVTSDDASLVGGDEFGTALYKGLYGSDPLVIMYATSSADGITDDIGSTTVAYTIGISEVQEMGDYTNTLTYICTPIF